MNLIEIFEQGGFVMYPLLFCSLLIWIVGLQKLFFYVTLKKSIDETYKDVERIVSANRVDELKWVFSKSHQVIAKSHEVIFDGELKTKEDVTEKLSRRLNETQSVLKNRLWILGTIGTSAPFVGLFGTVVGIMSSFKSVALNGKGGFAVVSAGISESLIATASGIIIAVIAVVFYNFLQIKANALFSDLKNKIEDLTQTIINKRRDSEVPPLPL